MKYLFVLFILPFQACVPVQSSNISQSNPKTLQLADIAYEPQIKTITLHPVVGDNTMPAAAALGQAALVLEFDDLRTQKDNYYAKIIHCTHNWNQSDLMDLDFMNDYNEFNITNYQFSIDTHVPYIHYSFNLPPVKLAGNYVVMVYRNGDKSDLVLTRRFMIYNNLITFTRDNNLINSGRIANINQQINFTINYEDVDIPNPSQNLWVVIRQNQRWDNMVMDLKPSFMRDIQHEVDYIYFDDKKMFSGGNEFRFFDLRSLNYPGQNVGYINKTVKPFEAYIQKDKSREDQPYAQYKDQDGNYTLSNYDYDDINFSNYVGVHFTLSSPSPVNGDVYVIGAFNSWNLDADNKMKYDSGHQEYTSRVLLKQGFYDYQYLVKSPTLPGYYFEGSHFETQNSYEVMVYYKPFQPRAEQLIGYIRFVENPR